MHDNQNQPAESPNASELKNGDQDRERIGNLSVSLREGESLLVGNIVFTFKAYRSSSQISVSIKAPKSVPIARIK